MNFFFILICFISFLLAFLYAVRLFTISILATLKLNENKDKEGTKSNN